MHGVTYAICSVTCAIFALAAFQVEGDRIVARMFGVLALSSMGASVVFLLAAVLA